MIGLVENIKFGTQIDNLEYKNKILYTPLRVLDIAKLLKWIFLEQNAKKSDT